MKQILTLQRGGVVILPTDTLYGIVGSALSRKTVERIYKLRRRNPKKPLIILIGSTADLKKFGIQPSSRIKKILKQWWPGKVSVILPIANRGGFLRKFSYLHRGTGTLAFRLPDDSGLRSLLKKTGPLVAPSANLEGEPSAKTIRAAQKYFGDGVDGYVDVGRLNAKPSTLVQLDADGSCSVLRRGAVKINMVNFL